MIPYRGGPAARTTGPRSWSARSCAHPAKSSEAIRAASRRSATCRGGRRWIGGAQVSPEWARRRRVLLRGRSRGPSVPPGDAMLHFAPDGRASVGRPRTACVPRPACRGPFRRARNWAFVRALLSDPESRGAVDLHPPRARGGAAAEATREGDDPAVVARASFIMKQPSDAEVHDDHMHVRFYCAAADRRLGCVDKGPVRWWKKMWKYMGARWAAAQRYHRGGRARGVRAAVPRRAAAHVRRRRSDELVAPRRRRGVRLLFFQVAAIALRAGGQSLRAAGAVCARGAIASAAGVGLRFGLCLGANGASNVRCARTQS